MDWAFELDLGSYFNSVFSRSFVPAALVFGSMAYHIVGSSQLGSRGDWLGGEGCSFRESAMVVECGWRGHCRYPPHRLRSRLSTEPELERSLLF